METATAYPIPANEGARLRELRSYDILRTPREQAFDTLVELASVAFDVPLSAISLIDADTQWFKASIGVGITETPRCEAFCAHTILSTQTLVVEDTLQDPRFRDFPLVAEHGVRFYVGAPLVTQRGSCIGALCVSDTVPRKPTIRQIRLLERLAALLMELLDARRSLADLSGLGAFPGYRP